MLPGQCDVIARHRDVLDGVAPQRRLMHLGKLSNLLGKDAGGNDQDLTKLVDGAVPASLMVRVQQIYREVEHVDTWSNW
jgi:hypothetical protein